MPVYSAPRSLLATGNEARETKVAARMDSSPDHQLGRGFRRRPPDQALSWRSLASASVSTCSRLQNANLTWNCPAFGWS